MELDGPHLHAGDQPFGVVDIEVVLAAAVLLADRYVRDVRAERAAVVLLEEAFPGATLGQRTRLIGRLAAKGSMSGATAA